MPWSGGGATIRKGPKTKRLFNFGVTLFAVAVKCIHQCFCDRDEMFCCHLS